MAVTCPATFFLKSDLRLAIQKGGNYCIFFFLQGRVGIKLGRAGNDLLILPLILARRF